MGPTGILPVECETKAEATASIYELRPFLCCRFTKRLKGIADDIIEIPSAPEFATPVLTAIPLQLFAYHVAVELGRDVDKPRNLAKSVTVE
ncbi:MAG: hypothetical protein DME42_12490 [Verrucomicrobia bacterium]|nr:MAG: hypothetical protein DME42_12490 [Verrucomicrobiota bacterium]